MVCQVLSDAQWKKTEHVLPGKVSDPGRTAADNRRIMEAVLWIARTGSPWRDLPIELGNWRSTYVRFARWRDAGVWERVAHALSSEAELKRVFTDFTIVRAHQHAAGAKKKPARRRSRGGLSTKLHLALDAPGHPLRLTLTAGQIADIDCAHELIEDLRMGALIADKGYDADAFVDAMRRGRPKPSSRHDPTASIRVASVVVRIAIEI